ncbi:hypothetical protein B1813_22390 [Saccharomonospora piscinae]|uniref:Uncharacterized protein n=1 Tax=Saccharomonospora piscinae TaxID=687388 RepID=A0A1V8ZY05_SACPI|nr:hypothetical protein [Saccharomonospora piscinae]OQO89656.1 hypothetical protein B1813_22390 [Saccharomonospora piscinae]
MNAATSPLGTEFRKLLQAAGGQPGPTAIAELGGWEYIASQVAGLVGDPAIVPLIALVVRDAEPADPDAAAAIRAVVDATLDVQSPAGFGDCVSMLVASASTVAAQGAYLAGKLQVLVEGFTQIDNPSEADVSRTADSLEGLTQLRIGEVGKTPFALLAFLQGCTTPVPPRLAKAVIRSVGTAVDYWPAAAEFAHVVKAQAGMTPPSGTPAPGADTAAIESDASWVLANIELVTALRAPTPVDMAGHLKTSCGYLALAAETYEREDAEVLAGVLKIIAKLVSAGDRPLSALESAIPDVGTVGIIVERAAEFNITSSGLDHWYSDMKRQTLASWVALAEDLREVRDQFAQESFYRPEQVIDRILQIYLASRSALVVRRGEDFDAVLDVVQPVIEDGFASKAGFLANLEQYTRELEDRANTTPDDASSTAVDLDIARQLLSSTREAARRGAPPGKAEGGAAHASLPRALEEIVGTGTPDAERLASLEPETLQRIMQVVQERKIARNITLSEGEILNRLRPVLDACPDYNSKTRDAIDQLLLLVIRFVADRVNAQSDRKSYLFRDDADENDLHQDLYDYLMSVLGPTVELEVPHIGGGRVDIRVRYSAFALHLELKADHTKKDLLEKRSYMKQAVSYQATDISLGFLVALRLKAFPSGEPLPLITSLFNATTINVPGDKAPRHLILVSVPGNKTRPSDMSVR